MDKEQIEKIEDFKAALRAADALRKAALACLPKVGDRVHCAGIEGTILEVALDHDGYIIRCSGYTESEDTWLNGRAFEPVRKR